MIRIRSAIAIILLIALRALAAETPPAPYFGIRVVDEATERGVPLVELRTTNDIALVTDSAGWVAFHEPGMMDREIYFGVSGAGYEYAADGFGNRGVRLTTKPGKSAVLKIKRVNIAERLYRVTGQGTYRDSELLGHEIPAGAANLNSGVVGQDSVQAVPYRGRVFWLWGDTSIANYPLGNFQTTSATSPPPEMLDPASGIPLTYLMDRRQPDRLRAMAPLAEAGLVWLFGLLSIEDDKGEPALVAHYARLKRLDETVEHGLMRLDDESGVFRKIVELDLDEKWRYPRGTARRVEEKGGPYYYFCDAFAQTRVAANWESVIDPASYEALTFDPAAQKYEWQRRHPPTTQAEERKLIESDKLKPADARYQLAEASSEKPVRDLHRSSIAWNDFRKKWIYIGVQRDFSSKPSFLGEVWYAEAEHISGPWQKAVKIATHPNYSFYNPRHHTFLDQEGGRFIYFEGTYTRAFSGNPTPTPRYDYNQVMYRLDLADERLHE